MFAPQERHALLADILGQLLEAEAAAAAEQAAAEASPSGLERLLTEAAAAPAPAAATASAAAHAAAVSAAAAAAAAANHLEGLLRSAAAAAVDAPNVAATGAKAALDSDETVAIKAGVAQPAEVALTNRAPPSGNGGGIVAESSEGAGEELNLNGGSTAGQPCAEAESPRRPPQRCWGGTQLADALALEQAVTVCKELMAFSPPSRGVQRLGQALAAVLGAAEGALAGGASLPPPLATAAADAAISLLAAATRWQVTLLPRRCAPGERIYFAVDTYRRFSHACGVPAAADLSYTHPTRKHVCFVNLGSR